MERTLYSFWINTRQRAGLKVVKDRIGISESEQIRQALDDWLTKRGVPAFTESAQLLRTIDRLEAKRGAKAKPKAATARRRPKARR